jgi:hypothetical protein
MSVVDSYLFEIGWLFFAGWSVILAVLLVVTFGRDFLAGSASDSDAGDHRSGELAGMNNPK